MPQKRNKKPKLTKHHIVNKCNGGQTTPENILLLFEEKHRAWHSIFGNADLNEAIAILQRVKQMKNHQQ